MSDKWSKYKDFKLEVEIDGEIRFLYVEVLVYYVRDPNYGADADGNRGMPVTFVDNWEIDTIYDQDADKIVTEELEHTPEVITAIEKELT